MTIIAIQKHLRSHGILFMLAGWLTILAPIITIAGRVPVDIDFSLIGILFLAHSISTRNWAWLRTNWVRTLGALWLYMCAHSFFVEHWQGAVVHSLVWVRFLVAGCALAFWILPDAKIRKHMLHALCAALVFLIADGFYQYWRGVDIFGQPTHLYGELFFRLTGPFYAQHLGLLMVWTVLPAACYMLATPRKHSLAALGGILLMALTVTLVFATGERMAFIFIVFACALFILFSRALRMRMLLVAALIATAIAGFSMVDHRLITRQVEGTSSDVENLSSSSYGQVWSSAANIALEHPLFGVGAKNFQPTCIKMHGFTEQNLQTDVPCPLHSHNFYLEWLVEHGAIGLSLWLLVCYHWLQLAWKNRQFIAGDAVASALMATLIIRFWPIAATSSQFTAWSAAPLWLAVGWLVALLNAQNAKQS